MHFVVPDFYPAAAELFVAGMSLIILMVTVFAGQAGRNWAYFLTQATLVAAAFITIGTLDGQAEAEKQQGDNRTMGRKHTVPYGLYVAHGFVSAFLAKQTGFSEGDLELLWEALGQMFEHDRSAARGEMATRGMYVFKHDSELGNAPAHALFERIQTRVRDGVTVPRSFTDYEVTVNDTDMPAGVSLMRKA